MLLTNTKKAHLQQLVEEMIVPLIHNDIDFKSSDEAQEAVDYLVTLLMNVKVDPSSFTN